MWDLKMGVDVWTSELCECVLCEVFVSGLCEGFVIHSRRKICGAGTR